jgi:hypothetical protein
LLRLFKEFFHCFAVILWVATALAFLGEWNQPGQGMAKIGYAIIAVIVVGDRLAYRPRPGCRKTQLAGYAAFFFVLCRLRRLIDHFDFAFLQINSPVIVKNENRKKVHRLESTGYEFLNHGYE